MEEFIEGLFDLKTPVGGYVPQYLLWLAGIVLTVVEISPIKINPWKWLLKKIGGLLTDDCIQEIKAIKSEVETVNERFEAHIVQEHKFKEQLCTEQMNATRSRILIFADEIRLGQNHSQEHLNPILQETSQYEQYCEAHRDYKNNKVAASISIIKRQYEEKLMDNDFLKI